MFRTMGKSRLFQMRLSSEQFEQIKKDAFMKGHSSVSSYVREVILKRGWSIDSKIVETNINVRRLLELLE